MQLCQGCEARVDPFRGEATRARGRPSRAARHEFARSRTSWLYLGLYLYLSLSPSNVSASAIVSIMER